jgi:hypothetical protein
MHIYILFISFNYLFLFGGYMGLYTYIIVNLYMCDIWGRLLGDIWYVWVFMGYFVMYIIFFLLYIYYFLY